jgi:hypothetical protein
MYLYVTVFDIRQASNSTKGGGAIPPSAKADGPLAPQIMEPQEHFDILIIGAGISGIDAAYHLQCCQL